MTNIFYCMRKLSSLAAFAILLSRQVLACPGCKDALSQNGVANPWSSAFNLSILFMLGTVLALACAMGYGVYRLVREEERRNGIAADPKALRLHRIGAGIVALIVAALIFWPSSASASKPMPVSDLPTLNDAALKTELDRSKGLMVIEVGATWCAPCRMMSPTVSSVAKDLTGSVPFYFMDYDASPGAVKQLQINDMPCLVLFKDGKEVGRSIGINSPAGLKEFIKTNSTR